MAAKTATPLTKVKVFSVTGRVSVDVTIEIAAKDWEDAVSQANQLKFESFVSLEGDLLDNRPVQIQSIWIDSE